MARAGIEPASEWERLKTLRTTQSRRISEGSILPLPGAKLRLGCGLRMLPFRRHISLPCSFDLFLLIFPGLIFRFPAMTRAGRVSIRTTTAGVIPVVVECFCHFIPPLGLIPGGPWLKTRRARSLPAVSLRMGKKGRSPRQGVAWSPLEEHTGLEPARSAWKAEMLPLHQCSV